MWESKSVTRGFCSWEARPVTELVASTCSTNLAPYLLDELLDRPPKVNHEGVHVEPQHPVVVRQPLPQKVGLVKVHVGAAPLSRLAVGVETHVFYVVPENRFENALL